MPKNKSEPRINTENDVEIVLYLLVLRAIEAKFEGSPVSSWFFGTDLICDPRWGMYLKDETGPTLNSNATKILDRATTAGILIDLGPKKAHGGPRPSIYTLNPAFWKLHINGAKMRRKEILRSVKKWYREASSFQSKLPGYDARYECMRLYREGGHE